MSSVNEFLYKKLVFFLGPFWFSVSTYVLPLFSFISTLVFRFKRSKSSLKYNSDIISKENNERYPNFVEPELESEPDLEAKQDVIGFTDSENDGFGEKEDPKFCFQFKFPTYDELSKSRGENGNFVGFEALSPTSTNKYQFMSEKSFSGFINKPEIVSFRVNEVNTDTNGGSFGDKDMVDYEVHSETEAVHEERPENSASGICGEEKTEEIGAMKFTEEKVQEVDEENNLLGDKNISDGFLSDGDFGGEYELDTLMEIDGQTMESHGEMSDSEENQESEDADDEASDLMEDLRNLEEPSLRNLDTFSSKFLSQEDFDEDMKKSKDGEFGGKDDKSESKKASVFDSEDTNELETLWEHQELIEQLKMELKKVRATGLPTILEESESPKIMEDLKPWKIEEKFQHENPMGELHKFYKSYRERMRKFDILNYQKMYAIGFLQLKDPLQSISTQKSSVRDITSLLAQNFSLSKRKHHESDPTMKFIKELQSDLEVVYVGHLCLSWEILHWQHGKALDLWDSDPRGVRRYNEVAGEFQQFEVLMQRFIEDEPFQGPRVQNYVKNRCVLRNLLQVPVIREDSSKNRKKARRSETAGDYAITSDMLVEIIEESIRIFWRFVRADKDCTTVIVKGRRGPLVELQDPTDSQLLMDVRKNLQKKERKLKDLLRSGNCILRKFQKCEEDSSDQVLYFFSQVDMKLVSRVLNMSRITTDQLVWCRNKLNKISFVNKKIHVEPSFLLFPC